MPLSVVQVVPSLGIGGVETYLYRLAHGLTARGHTVTFVVREQGEYAELATSTGARLVVVPFDLAGSERAAAELGDRAVHLVHAHNYRAARFAAPLARSLGCRYVMSVHGPRPWYKRAVFRNWSPIMIATSEADRTNVSGLFGLRRDRVAVTFLGIDTDRFNPVVDGGPFRAELGIGDRPLVVHVSRFTNRKVRPALTLIEAFREVRRAEPYACLALVGSGSGLERVRDAARKLERGSPKNSVHVLGKRTDIPHVFAGADVAVVAANTALEAIATGTGTITFGRTGYFGIVDAANLGEAQAVCFADHGRLARRGTPKELAQDILALLRSDGSSARELADLVEREFGSHAMTMDVEAIYERVLRGPGPGG